MLDPNFLTGERGLIAVDKVGNRVLFLDPISCETFVTLGGFTPRVHELLIAADRRTAYVPIYGDGIHGDNPRPGNLVARIDLEERRALEPFSTAPYLAPHGLRWGRLGQLYCLCENSGVVLELNAQTGHIDHVIDVGSTKAHRMEVLPNGTKLYTENEQDASCSIVDLQTRRQVGTISTPHSIAGIGMSPDGRTLVVVDAEEPRIFVIETTSDQVVSTTGLVGHEKPAQIARYSPDGRFLVVTSFDAPLATIFDANLRTQRLLHLGNGPMNMAFHPDGRTVVIANHGEGTLSICDLECAEVIRTVRAGVGIETLSFF